MELFGILFSLVAIVYFWGLKRRVDDLQNENNIFQIKQRQMSEDIAKLKADLGMSEIPKDAAENKEESSV